jgi:hypothetical protein
MRRSALHLVIAVLGCGFAQPDTAYAQGGIASYYGLDVNRGVSAIGSNSVDRYLYDTHFFHRPTVNPMLGLDRLDPIGGTNYHSFVRPERERRERAAQSQRAYVDARKRGGRVGETRFDGSRSRQMPPAANPRAAAANRSSSAARFNDLGRWHGGR